MKQVWSRSLITSCCLLNLYAVQATDIETNLQWKQGAAGKIQVLPNLSSTKHPIPFPGCSPGGTGLNQIWQQSLCMEGRHQPWHNFADSLGPEARILVL